MSVFRNFPDFRYFARNVLISGSFTVYKRIGKYAFPGYFLSISGSFDCSDNDANKICPRSLCAMRCFIRLYLHTQTAVRVHLTNHGYLDRGKNMNTPNWSPCLAKYDAGSGISGLWLVVMALHWANISLSVFRLNITYSVWDFFLFFLFFPSD